MLEEHVKIEIVRLYKYTMDSIMVVEDVADKFIFQRGRISELLSRDVTRNLKPLCHYGVRWPRRGKLNTPTVYLFRHLHSTKPFPENMKN